MPKVTIEWSSEEREALNAKGAARGCATCPSCGDSMLWKPFHATAYERGVIALANRHSKPGEKPREVIGDKSFVVLCEDCFKGLDSEKRAIYYAERLAQRRAGIKSVIQLVSEYGAMVDCPRDRARYDREKAEIDGEHAKILNAVRGEG